MNIVFEFYIIYKNEFMSAIIYVEITWELRYKYKSRVTFINIQI